MRKRQHSPGERHREGRKTLFRRPSRFVGTRNMAHKGDDEDCVVLGKGLRGGRHGRAEGKSKVAESGEDIEDDDGIDYDNGGEMYEA